MKYPKVLSEEDTLDAIIAGKSIARFGDGEFKLALNKDCVSQIANKNLTNELKTILINNNPNCLVGIPTLDKRNPKYENWVKFMNRDAHLKLLNYKSIYTSAFITRPDSAPWCDNSVYWDKIVSLWKDKDVILVKGTERSLRTEMMVEAKSITVVSTERRDAYSNINKIEAEILSSPIKTVILCVGAAATCLAWRLSNKGKHALDLGHVGMTMRRRGQYSPTAIHTFKD